MSLKSFEYVFRHFEISQSKKSIPARFKMGCRADRFTIVNAIHNFVNPIHNFVNAIHKKIEKNLDRHSLREKVVEDSGREK